MKRAFTAFSLFTLSGYGFSSVLYYGGDPSLESSLVTYFSGSVLIYDNVVFTSPVRISGLSIKSFFMEGVIEPDSLQFDIRTGVTAGQFGSQVLGGSLPSTSELTGRSHVNSPSIQEYEFSGDGLDILLSPGEYWFFVQQNSPSLAITASTGVGRIGFPTTPGSSFYTGLFPGNPNQQFMTPTEDLFGNVFEVPFKIHGTIVPEPVSATIVIPFGMYFWKSRKR